MESRFRQSLVLGIPVVSRWRSSRENSFWVFFGEVTIKDMISSTMFKKKISFLRNWNFQEFKYLTVSEKIALARDKFP